MESLQLRRKGQNTAMIGSQTQVGNELLRPSIFSNPQFIYSNLITHHLTTKVKKTVLFNHIANKANYKDSSNTIKVVDLLSHMYSNGVPSEIAKEIIIGFVEKLHQNQHISFNQLLYGSKITLETDDTITIDFGPSIDIDLENNFQAYFNILSFLPREFKCKSISNLNKILDQDIPSIDNIISSEANLFIFWHNFITV